MRRALVVLVAALALPAPALAQGGAAKPVVGGGSFNTAPLLGPGTYDDTVAAGETVYWKVRLAKGQVLRVKATVDTSQIQTDPLADGFDKGLANLNYFLDIFSPLREQLSEESGGTYDTASARLEGSPAAGAKTGTATGPRVLGFEQILASDYNEDKFPAPGEWYVSLNAADTATFPAEVPAELPVELQVQVIGQAQPSSPDFARALPGPRKQQPASPDTSIRPGTAPRHRRPTRRPRPDPRARRRHRPPRRPRPRHAGHRRARARAPAHVASLPWRAGRSSSSTSTRRARCTTTSASRSTGCSSRGPSRRGRRPTRARSAWPSPWRTTRWPTPTSRARSGRATTAPARSSCGTPARTSIAPSATARRCRSRAPSPTDTRWSSSRAASCGAATP